MNERHGSRRDHPADRPAPTITSKARSDVLLNTRQKSLQGGKRVIDYKRPVGRPAPTLTVQAGAFWQFESDTEPVKLTVVDALLLQGFPPDYPVQGSRTKAFEQIGNAVPPALAASIVDALTAVHVQGTVTERTEGT